MSYDGEFDDMLPQTVTVRTLSSRNGDGSPSFSTAQSQYDARVVNTKVQTRDLQGNVVQANHVAWIASTSVLSASSRFALPDGSTPPVLNLTTWPDERGNYFTKVWFGS